MLNCYEFLLKIPINCLLNETWQQDLTVIEFGWYWMDKGMNERVSEWGWSNLERIFMFWHLKVIILESKQPSASAGNCNNHSVELWCPPVPHTNGHQHLGIEELELFNTCISPRPDLYLYLWIYFTFFWIYFVSFLFYCRQRTAASWFIVRISRPFSNLNLIYEFEFSRESVPYFSSKMIIRNYMISLNLMAVIKFTTIFLVK